MRFLTTHPAFRRSPLIVGSRAIAWEAVKLMGRPLTVRVHAGARMRLYPPRSRHGHVGLVYVFREDYEPSVREAVDAWVSDGSVVFDIGANIGLWTLRMAERAGSAGRVHAFEPVPPTARNLRENVRLSQASTVEVHELALADQPGTLSIHVPPGAAGRASLAPESDADEAFDVPVGTLDDMWEAVGMPKVTFVKVDIEGAEPLMLRGARRFFSTQRPAVACEINGVKLRRLGQSPDGIFDFFAEYGYAPYRWTVETGFEPDGSREDGDVLFLSGPARS